MYPNLSKIVSESKDGKNFGLHIHTPDAATKKDGPSAGAAMTIAIYSILSKGTSVNMVLIIINLLFCNYSLFL